MSRDFKTMHALLLWLEQQQAAEEAEVTIRRNPSDGSLVFEARWKMLGVPQGAARRFSRTELKNMPLSAEDVAIRCLRQTIKEHIDAERAKRTGGDHD